MSRPNLSTALAEVVVDELVRTGVETAYVSPGSRSGALAIAAQAHPGLDVYMVLDERSASFHALGSAKAGGQPSAVVCTSGTATANFLPAVVEADMSLAPLVVVTADRPEELRGVGANQTIDQFQLYGEKVRAFHHIEPPSIAEDENQLWRTGVSDLVARARGFEGRPGPVQLNVAFREPTVPVSDDGRSVAEPFEFAISGRPGGGPWHAHRLPPTPTAELEVGDGSRGLVIAGDGDYDRPGLLAEADRLGWPVLATALSGLRGDDVVSRYHHIAASGVPPHLAPSVALVVGAVGPSTRLERLAAGAPEEYRMDSWGRSLNPSRSATAVLAADPIQALGSVTETGEPGWRESWMEAERRLAGLVPSAAELSGPGVAEALNRLEWGCLVAGSSLAIRDVDAHLRRRGPVIANRGASGIDGFVSTALGVAQHHARTLALTGDLSLLHDNNGFLSEVDGDLTVIVVDNSGGGLFDLLPQAEHAPDFERLFVAPHRRDLRVLADFHQLEYEAPDSIDALESVSRSAMDRGGRNLVHVTVDRGFDRDLRALLDARARELLA